MRAVIQRVQNAAVSINGGPKRNIGKGLVVLAGVFCDDGIKDIDWTSEKILNLRVFANEDGKFDKSVMDIRGEILVISQFTLYGGTKKGRRPDFTQAADSETAQPLYNKLVENLKASGLKVETGEFGAHMLIDIANDGPVTLILDSRQ